MRSSPWGLSLPRLVGLSLALLALVALSLTPKILLGQPAEADSGRLMRDAAARLDRAGFATRVEFDMPSERLVAGRGGCRLLAWSADRGKYVASAFAAEGQATGPLRFARAGRWSPDPPGLPSELARYVVNRLNAFGITLSRPASLAVAASPACPASLPMLFEGLRIWPQAIGPVGR